MITAAYLFLPARRGYYVRLRGTTTTAASR